MKVSKNMIVTDTVPGPGWNFDSILAELTGERWTASHGGLKYKLSGRKEKIRRYKFSDLPIPAFFTQERD